MERMTLSGPSPTHDFLRLRRTTSLLAEAPVPSWVAASLDRAPWVVVRRGIVVDGSIPVGVRGADRRERFAAWLDVAEIVDRLSPEDLADSLDAIEVLRKQAVPAFAALDRVAPLLRRRGYRWGPGGSVAFEMATGIASATTESDLDLVLRQDARLEFGEAADLVAALSEAAGPVRVDAILETPSGGLSLAELAEGATESLVRTPWGPRLSVDPWNLTATIPAEAAP